MVIDASVATKWFLKEPDSLLARELLKKGNIPFVAPDLIRMEVSAAISKAVRLQQVSGESAHYLFEIWNEQLKKGMIQLASTSEDEHIAFELSISLGHSLQDCYYLAVAQRCSLPVLTMDKKLMLKAKQADIPYKSLRDMGH